MELLLPLLSEAAVAAYLTRRFADAGLPAGLAHLVHQRTEGHPLFMVTVVDDWVRRGWLVQADAGWTPGASSPPSPARCPRACAR